MATATKRRKAQQKTFEATKDVAGGIPELDEIGGEYLEVASERGRLGEQLKGLKQMMTTTMQKHKKRVYKIGDATFELDHIEEDKLLVKRPKDKDKTEQSGETDFGDEEE